MSGHNPPLPLTTLLSQALVAFTIEADNEFEHCTRHRTTVSGSAEKNAPWLISMAMWLNCLRYVDADGITLGELHALARTPTNLDGMRRWRWIDLDSGPVTPKAPKPTLVLRATRAGQHARELWQALPELIEERWRERFGETAVRELREALEALAGRLDSGLPDCMPILGYGLFLGGPRRLSALRLTGKTGNAGGLILPALLARPLAAFALEFEQHPDVSLAVCANVLRLLSEEAVRVRDLPRLSGVSKESIAMALGFLEKGGYATVRPEAPGSRFKAVTLTLIGLQARDRYLRLTEAIEECWNVRYGEDLMRRVYVALAQVVGPDGTSPLLMQRLEPYPEGWRAAVAPPEVLPHFPMVLHRGGYPDGA